jgi:hypothetical protein
VRAGVIRERDGQRRWKAVAPHTRHIGSCAHGWKRYSTQPGAPRGP